MMSISRPPQSPDPKPATPREAATPQSDGTVEGSLRTKVVAGTRPKEEKLAGYLMARAATHQAVDGQDLVNLRIGNESVQKVCDSLPLGRSNVFQDVDNTPESHLPLRKIGTQAVAKKLMLENRESGEATTPTEFYRGTAGATLFSQTGTCGSFATVNAPVHAARLRHLNDTQSIVTQVNHKEVDHAWTEMLVKGMSKDGKLILHEKDVVMDGWSKEHLAILREDSHFARLDKDGKGAHLNHFDQLDHSTGQDALQAVLGYKARIDESPNLQAVYGSTIKGYLDAGIEASRNNFWNDTSIFHADFLEQSVKALHKDVTDPSLGVGPHVPDVDSASMNAKHATMAEIQAVGVARSLGANIQGAMIEAPRIITAAKEMFPVPVSFFSRLMAYFGS